jgi:Tfp pilus assembly protein PilP
MKLTTTILAVVMMTGAAWGQNQGATDNTRSVGKSPQQMKSPQQIKTNDTKTTLLAAVPAQSAKPAPGAPAPAVKPATLPKPASVPAMSPNNLLEKVNVVRNPGEVQIEINSREAVTPKVSRLSSPARVVLELPSTLMANAQDKIPVGSAGVKDIRIGMDGKTPPTTTVVVDLEKALSYDLSQGAGNKLILTLHTPAPAPVAAKTVAPPAPAVAKTSPPVSKPQTASAKPVVVSAPAPVAKSTPVPAMPSAPTPKTLASAKPVVTTPAPATVAKSNPAPAKTPAPAPKPAVQQPQTASAKPVVALPVPVLVAKNHAAPAPAKSQDIFTPNKPVVSVPAAAVKLEAPQAAAKTASSPAAPSTTKIAANEKLTVVSKTADVPKPSDAAKTAEAPKPPKPEEKKWAMTGKRDPFFSPVVQQSTGPGCSTGKKCLDIGQINLRGVVKSENGFIAVVTNSLNKAYFLHENDPVFNGYVMKITGDSVVFQETVQDKLGKPLTREVVKRIFTPAV